jgi:hypothetical protein
MREDDIEAAATYTDMARARLVMAYEACELSDLARAAVPIGEYELSCDGIIRTPGAALADAAEVLAAAHRFFEAAVVFERAGGAAWETIGEVLGTSAHAARKRFGMAESRFRLALRLPDGVGTTGVSGGLTWWRSHMINEPLEAALDLDDWVLRHSDGDEDLGVAPVSGGLMGDDGGVGHAER